MKQLKVRKQIIDKIVDETLNNIRKPKRKLVEGVQYDSSSNSFTFDFTQDSERDIIKLTNYGLYQSNIYNKCFYFKYQFEDDVDSSVRANFIEYIKFHENMDNGDVSTFIEKAVNSLDDTINIREYNTIVYPQSISEINRKAISYIRLFGYPDFLTFELVKEPPSELCFDYISYKREVLDATHKVGEREYPKYTEEQKEERIAQIKKMMETLKNSNYFSIGRDMKYKYRKYLKNFYNFGSEEEKDAFNKLAQPKVMVIDDVMTSGATLNYIINTIYKVNPNATVVVFTLIGK